MEFLFILPMLVGWLFILIIALIVIIVKFIIELIPYVLAFILIFSAIGSVFAGGAAIAKTFPCTVQTLLKRIISILGIIIIGSYALAAAVFLFGLLISPFVLIFSLVEFKTLLLWLLFFVSAIVCFLITDDEKEKENGSQ